MAEAAPGANVNTGRREVAGPSKDAIHSSPRAAPNEELLDGASPGRRRSSVQSGESHAGAGEGEEDRAAARVAERVERARAARQTQREESHTVRTLRQERDEWQQRSIIAEAALALHQAPKPEHATCLVQTDEVECVEVGALEDEQERRHVAEEEAAGLRRRLQQSEQAERGNTEQLEARAIKGATAQLEAHAAELAEARAAQVEQLEQASLLEAARAEVTAARRQAEELAAARAALGAMEVHSLRTSDDLTATSAALAAAEARAAELQRSVAARSAAGGGAFHARGRRRFDAQASTTATPQQSTGAEAQAQAEGAQGAEAEVPEWGEVRRLQAALDEAARCGRHRQPPPHLHAPLPLSLTAALILAPNPNPSPHLALSRRVAELETAPRAEPARSPRVRVGVPRLSSPRATSTGSMGSPNTPSSARNGASATVSADPWRNAMSPLGQLLPSPGKLRSRGTPKGRSPARTLEVHNWPKLAAPWRVPAELTGQD